MDELDGEMRFKKKEGFKAWEGLKLPVVAFEVGGQRPWAKECGWPLEAGNDPQLTASKKMGNFVLISESLLLSFVLNIDKQGNKLISRGFRKECSLLTHWFQLPFWREFWVNFVFWNIVKKKWVRGEEKVRRDQSFREGACPKCCSKEALNSLWGWVG